MSVAPVPQTTLWMLHFFYSLRRKLKQIMFFSNRNNNSLLFAYRKYVQNSSLILMKKKVILSVLHDKIFPQGLFNFSNAGNYSKISFANHR